jgi:hypothetical protein
LIFYALPQQASLSQNAQWRSHKPFKPLLDFVSYLFGTAFEVVSRRQIRFKSKAQTDEKAQHTR